MTKEQKDKQRAVQPLLVYSLKWHTPSLLLAVKASHVAESAVKGGHMFFVNNEATERMCTQGHIKN